LSDVENRCKHCAVREVFYCPKVRRAVEVGNEVRNCKHFKPKDRGMPRDKKIQGSLGG